MAPRVLLIGGHGKVSLLLTPLLLARSWHVTSLIRDSSQTDDILSKGKGQPGRVDVLVRSLEEVKSDSDAQKVLDEVKPDYVVWSAGAGGKGGSGRTYAIDRDAAKHFISSAVATSSISKFLMVSYVGSRRNRPPWWNDEEWASCQKVNTEVLPHYYAAKVEADEQLAALSKKRHDGFQAIDLRPGNLTDDAATGKVSLGHTTARGKISRADVADVAARLLERNDTRGWYDLLSGDENVEEAVERVVREKVNCIEGEN